jgi:PAS domain S-box-containing protein
MDNSILRGKDTLQILNTRDKLLNLVITNLPLMLFLIDRDGIIRLSVGKQPGPARRISPETINQSIYQVLASEPETIQQFERSLNGISGSVHTVTDSYALDTHYSPLRGSSGEIIGVIGVSIDVTERRRAEEALAQSEARFQTLFERAAIGVVLKNLDGTISSFNPAFLNMLGYSAEEMSKFRYIDITHPLDQPASRRLFRELVTGQRESYSLDKRYLRKDGSYCWARMTASLIKNPDGEPQFVIGMVEDITPRKEMEAELAEVQRRLAQSRELERLRLAQELHDGPLQEVIGINYQLKALENHDNEVYNLNELQTIEKTLDRLAETLRDIAGQLRPPALAPYGLEKAIRSHAEQFIGRHPEIDFVLRLAQDRQTLSNETRLALFRIYQEACTNIIRHSGAKTVWVRFLMDDDYAVLEIQDNGGGFYPPGRWIELAREGHLGLLGAIERAEAVGGRLDIETQPGQGTLIRAVVPRLGAKQEDWRSEK